MKYDGIEHFDDFTEDVLFWIDASDLPPVIQQQAKQIDMKEFDEKSFGICVAYNVETDDFCIVTDTNLDTGEERNVYYIDICGDKNWYKIDIPDDFVNEMIAECRNKLPIHSNGINENGFTVSRQM